MQNVLNHVDTHHSGSAFRGQAIYAAIILYSFIIFAIDLSLNTGIATGITYLLAVWAAYRAPRPATVWVTAFGVSVLVVLGAIFSTPGGDAVVILTNRVLSLFAIWGTALLCWQIHLTRENLAEREHQVQQIIESAPTAMLMTDTDGNIVLTNAEALHLFGYDTHELIGRPVDILVPERLRIKHPELRSGFTAHPTTRAMGAGRDLHAARKDGSEVAVEIGLTPIIHQEQLYILSAVVDISQRKALEDSLRALNQELEQRVEERTTELLSANEALVRSNVELQQFAYIASHDLQTPLRGISGFVQLLEREYGDKLDSEAHYWIKRTVDNTQRMHTLINDLLAYSRVDSRARSFVPVDLEAIVDETARLFEADLEHADLHITHDRLPTVMGDPSQLSQLFGNLIGNGIKYNTASRPQVHISATQEDKEWVISVRDNGIGIEQNHYEHIFEIFKRLHTDQTYPGTGIGLAVCRRVVHRHGGRIWIES
ncbi:MAG: PAS domain S-box protein, partial [Gammaproteobacteria bacterium]|nr:PAS domain S-box protein [Gammaproteobacteria bacterium]